MHRTHRKHDSWLHKLQCKVVKGKRLGSVLVKQFSRALPRWAPLQYITYIAEIPWPDHTVMNCEWYSDTCQIYCNFSGNQTFRTIDVSYHRWTFRTVDFSYHRWAVTWAWNSTTLTTSHRLTVWTDEGIWQTDGRAIAYSALSTYAIYMWV